MARDGGRCGGRPRLLGAVAGIAVIALLAVPACVPPSSADRGLGSRAGLTAGEASGTVAAAPAATTASVSTEPTRTAARATGIRSQGSSPGTDAAGEIRGVLDTWCAGVNSHDLELKMSVYADVVSPFFGKSRATKAEVRKVFGGAFAQYASMRQRLERVDIKVTGDRATVVVYKTRVYDGDPGWAEERLGLARTAEGWRIVSERDIRASD